MKKIYSTAIIPVLCLLLISFVAKSQTPTQVTTGVCSGVVANFNSTDDGFNSPSVYGSIFDSSLYYHAGRGYFTDYLPPYRTGAPGAPRVMNLISPPYTNPNSSGTFNLGFHYIVPNPASDRFQVRVISITQTSTGTVSNVVATSGVQFFASWPPAATPYVDGVTTTVPDPTPLLNGFEGNICIRLIDPDIINGPNTTFRIEVSYLINEPFFAVFDNVSIGPQALLLPVDFIGLVAERDNNSTTVNLKWDVTQEIDVREYQVQRSTTGSDFATVGTVNAKGKSIYTLSDFNTPSNTLFYRIKSVDIDGRTKYSGVLRISGNNSFSKEIKIYPVPAANEITVQHARINRGAKLIITSADGQVLRVIMPAVGASHTPVNISSLRSGTYFVRLDDGNGDIQTAKLVKP